MSEKEDKEATTTQHLTQQQTDNHNQTSGPTTAKQTGPTHGNNWPNTLHQLAPPPTPPP